MPLHGPLVVVAAHPDPDLLRRLGADGAFPVIAARPHDIDAAIAAARPSAVLLAEPGIAADHAVAQRLAETLAASAPIVPVMACVTPDQDIALPGALALPADASPETVSRHLSSVLRVRQLHATMLQRADYARRQQRALPQIPDGDPLDDAAIVVAGRGRDYPQIATLVGERAGLIGALSIETAARYLKGRETDGLVIADGFNPWNVGALLTALAENPRYRDLPVGILGRPPAHDAARLLHVVHAEDPRQLVRRFLPLARLHAFAARLRRLTVAFDSNGAIDPATNLHVAEAFLHALTAALADADARATGLSLARFSFAGGGRMKADAARLLSRLIRGTDFACQDDDGSVLVAFADTDLKHAHVVARRIAAILKHTMLAPGEPAAAPLVTLVARKAGDDAASLIARASVTAIAAE